MSETRDPGRAVPGMPVYGADGALLGPVEAVEPDGLRVLGRAVPAAAIARVGEDGVHLRLARAAFAAAPPQAAEAAAGERLVVPVAEERLVVGTRQAQVGEVAVEKRVVEDEELVPVTVRREEVEVIYRAPGEPRDEPDDPSVVEVTRIPLRGEEPVLATEPVVAREVVIDRAVRAEERRVGDTVRRTEVAVERHPGAPAGQGTPGEAREERRGADRREEGRVASASNAGGTGAATNRHTVVGAFEGPDRAERALNGLKAAGFTPEQVSVVAKDKADTQQLAERTEMAGEGAAAGAVTGGVLGGIAGFLVGISALVIPGIGPIVGGGILLSTLAGAGLGAAAGGLVGALAEHGVPEEDARGYEAHVGQGRILLTAHANDEMQAQAAHRAFNEAGGADVRGYSRAVQ